jgi:XTP/dITP diphosphohydrolase
MKAYVATKNAGKLAELRAIFDGSPLELHAYDGYGDVVEDAGSYRGNALLKARALARQLRDAGIDAGAVGDDSGFEVDALDGRPGVYSARYGGAGASWPQRRARLLNEMRDVPESKRGARFVSALAFVEPGGEELTSFGTVEGRVFEEERGARGFGYDPLFYYPPRGCTFAELSTDEKNAVSHRRAAANELLEALRRRD